MGITAQAVQLLKYVGSDVLASGSARVQGLANAIFPMTVWVDPVAGDTVRVRYSTDGGTTWRDSSISGATAYQETVFDSPVTDLEFQRTAGSGTTSKYGVC